MAVRTMVFYNAKNNQIYLIESKLTALFKMYISCKTKEWQVLGVL